MPQASSQRSSRTETTTTLEFCFCRRTATATCETDRQTEEEEEGRVAQYLFCSVPIRLITYFPTHPPPPLPWPEGCG